MKQYSIVRIGNEYVVRVNDRGVLKTASKRRAVRLVSHAQALLEAQSASAIMQEATIVPADSEVP
jgi:hypothetical protein